MPLFFIGLQHLYNQSKAFVQPIRSLRTICPKPPYNLSEAFGQSVRDIRTRWDKP